MNPGLSEPDALYAAAVVHWRSRRRDEAIKLIDEALRRRPDFAAALCMGGYMLGECGKPEPALRFYQRALELDVSLIVAHVNAGKLHFRAGRFDEALRSFEAATALAPDDADAWSSRAGALRELGRLEESLEAARHALSLRGDFPEAAINLGNALLKLDRPEEALDAYRRANAAAPSSAAAHCGRALALRSLGRFPEALAAFEAAEALGSREARAGKGCLLLTLGDFERGLDGYEARWLRGKSLGEALGARFETWRGPGRPGERVLVLNDHGLGDTIQFFRYLPLMTAAGVEAAFACPPRLRRLLSSKARVRFVDSPSADDPFDAQIAISSLPHAFGTRLDTIPAAVPYLAAEPPLRELWARRIGSAGFKIGIVWQGNPDPEADRARSMPLSALAPLAEVAGVRLISLQKGVGEEQLSVLPPSMRVETLGADFDAGPDAFVDTAAAMAALDLIVTCDTSIAHLAGALAAPVWVALKSDAEWRWLAGRAEFALVPDDAPLSSVAARRLARRVRRHGARGRRARRAPRRVAPDFDAMRARRIDRQDHHPAESRPRGSARKRNWPISAANWRCSNASRARTVPRDRRSTCSPIAWPPSTPACGPSRTPFGRASARETSGRASSRSRDRSIARTMSAPR